MAPYVIIHLRGFFISVFSVNCRFGFTIGDLREVSFNFGNHPTRGSSMASKKRPRQGSKVHSSFVQLVDPLESATVTFACDLYPDHSSSFLESAQVIKSRTRTNKGLKSKKRAA